jgi:uncharacterized membrane protein YvlD (DUF360 family)
VVKNKKKILEEARALGLVGTDTTTSLTGRSVLRSTQDFYGNFFHVVTYFEGFFFCSAPDKESGPASWDFSPRASLNQTLKEVKITGLILTVCPSREYPILLLLCFPLYVLYSSCQQAIVENMLLFWEMTIVMTQSSCTRWVSVIINVSSGVTQVSHGMIFQSSSEVSDGMIMQSSSDISCGMIFQSSSEGSCGIGHDLFLCFFLMPLQSLQQWRLKRKRKGSEENKKQQLVDDRRTALEKDVRSSMHPIWFI